MAEEEKEKVELKADEKEQAQVQPDGPVTIMPTMIDDSEDKQEKRRDLSAITPKGLATINEGELTLTSKDANLKGDGAVSIGTISVEGEAVFNPNAKLPEQIDIEERKKIAQKNKGIFKKEKKKKSNKLAQKNQNIASLVALITIAGLVGFFFWAKNRPTEKDFQPLHVEVELGEGLPIRTESYVKPGVGTKVDELQYVLDLSNVKSDEVGDYPFTVTFKGITKNGTISIVDTTAPTLEVRDVKIKEGDSYTPDRFVANCFDYSGCNTSFKEIGTETKYIAPGTHVIYIIATDAYQNTVTKQASLTIEAAGTKKEYRRTKAFDFNTGYELEEKYVLTFLEYDTYSAIYRGTFTTTYRFQDEDKFKAAIPTYSGEAGCTIDEADKSIIITKSVTSVGLNYTHLDDVENYLIKEERYQRW